MIETKYHLILFVIALASLCQSCNNITKSSQSDREIECYNTDESIIDEDDFESFMRSQIGRLIASASKGDASEFASLCRYPIERLYPLHDVMDSADMVDRYDLIFDKTLKEAVAATKIDDWGECNWRGYTFGDGGHIWLDGNVYLIPYHSKAEILIREDLIKKDMCSIKPELAIGWFPELCLIDSISDTIYRIDVREIDAMETECRLMAYDKMDSPNCIPKLILIGHKELQGTADTRCFIFPCKDGAEWVICDMWYENKITLYVEGKDEICSSINLKKIYWLDIIANQ